MTGQTPKTLLPTMLDSDPMATVAERNRALATALDGRIPKSGSTTQTTDASGNLTLTHGLGYVPTYLGAHGTTGAYVIGFSALTTTTATVNVRLSTTGAAAASTAVTLRWMAF